MPASQNICIQIRESNPSNAQTAEKQKKALASNDILMLSRWVFNGCWLETRKMRVLNPI